jgi:hypothetical protein
MSAEAHPEDIRMSKKPAAQSPESVTEMLAVVGVALDPARAANVAATVSAYVAGANKAFVTIAFETEPATYLKTSAEDAA